MLKNILSYIKKYLGKSNKKELPSNVTDFKTWKETKGIDPVGEWSYFDINTGKTIEKGLLYDHKTHWDIYPTSKEQRKC